MTLRITPALVNEFRRFNAAQDRARDEYDWTIVCGTDCPTAKCRVEQRLCVTCRNRYTRRIQAAAPADRPALREEYADLLALPGVPRPRAQCGTEGGYRAHRRRSEPACKPCLRAAKAAETRRKQKS